MIKEIKKILLKAINNNDFLKLINDEKILSLSKNKDLRIDNFIFFVHFINIRSILKQVKVKHGRCYEAYNCNIYQLWT